jgi:hypothetical protein
MGSKLAACVLVGGGFFLKIFYHLAITRFSLYEWDRYDYFINITLLIKDSLIKPWTITPANASNS